MGAIILFILNALAVIIFIIVGIKKTAEYKSNYKLALSSKTQRRVNHIISIIAGAACSFYILRWLSFQLEGFDEGLKIHISACLISISIIATLVFSYKKLYLNVKCFLIPILSVIFTASFLGIFYPYFVFYEAIKIAEGQEYCIELASEKREVRALEDLTLFTMDKSKHGHHAALLVKKNDGNVEGYHWSYLKARFIKGILGLNNNDGARIYCAPKDKFFKEIRYRHDKYRKYNTELYLNNTSYSIPADYDTIVNYKDLNIAASFDPKYYGYEDREYYQSEIIFYKQRDYLERKFDDYKKYASAMGVNNLSTKMISPRNAVYYKRNETGEIQTLIKCKLKAKRGNRYKACKHKFYRDGVLYIFSHHKKHLSETDRMQDNFYKTHQSFILRN